MGWFGKLKVGLALGGGAARGLAHIGVLEALHEAGVKVACVAGTSAGSIVGALYAGGHKPKALRELALKTRWRDLTEVIIPKDGLLGTERLERLLDELLGGRSFAQLDVPFAAVATDLSTGAGVVLDSGCVARAVRASCAVPGIFPPVRHEGLILADGGLRNNVPVAVARELGANYVIAVELHSGVPVSQPKNIFEVLIQTVAIIQWAGTEPQVRQADLVIQPDLQDHGLFSLDKPKEVMDIGYRAAMQALTRLPRRARRR